MPHRAQTATCPFTGRTAAPSASPAPAGDHRGADPARREVRRRTVLGAAVAALVASGLQAGPLGAVRAAAAGRRALRGTHGQSLRGSTSPPSWVATARPASG